MNEQDFKSHRQLVITWHVLIALGLIALLGGSIRYLIVCPANQAYPASLLILVSFILIGIYLHTRRFALKAQDRAIRAEENLRYFILTGKRLDARIAMKQLIALRFAGDDEFPALAQRAADEKLEPDAIKKEIRNWRADWHRV
jgi:hypothetical protein